MGRLHLSVAAPPAAVAPVRGAGLATVQRTGEGGPVNGATSSSLTRDNTKSAPDRQVAFRIDFPTWLNPLTERDRRRVEDLMLGERTLNTTRRHGLSPAG